MPPTDPPGAGPHLTLPAAPHLTLIDGSGFIFRAFHALPAMTDPSGTPVNAVYGFVAMLERLLRGHSASHLAVIFDAGRETFRNRLYADYKAHRPPAPDELVPQFPLVREVTRAFGVPAIELADWEADDLIASYANAACAAGMSVTIVSSDKDLMQLIRPGILLQDPIRNTPIDRAAVLAKFGVPPELLIDAQALMGDAVDNVPGVPGIGPKTAARLLTEFGDLDRLLAAAPAMKPGRQRDLLLTHADAALLSRQLVTLRQDAPLPLPLADLITRPPDPAPLAAMLARLGFRSLLARLGLTAPPDAPPGAASAPDAPPAAGPHAVPFGPYPIVANPAALAEFLATAAIHGQLALSFVADAPESQHPRLVGVGLATAPGRAVYLPLAHLPDLDRGPPDQVGLAATRTLLDPILADPSILKVAHDLKAAARLLGLSAIAPADDVMLIAYALEAGLHGFGLDALIQRHLGTDLALPDPGSGRARQDLAALAPDRLAPSVAGRADGLLRLRATLHPCLRTAGALALYEQVDRRLTPILAAMEDAGITVDIAELQRISVEFAARMAEMEGQIHALTGHSFNLGSPKQLGEILFDRMGLPGGKRMKTGAWGTDAQVLQALAEDGHVLPARILEWRQLAKLKSTYADALVGQVDAQSRVHTRYAMAATTTGRLSSIDPNLQNIPVRTAEGARIRAAFRASPGHLLVSADYSQIELRLLAHVADLPALRESFARAEDIHARTASEVFGVPMQGMDAATRRRAKAINFGIIYGISAFGLARQLAITPAEARAYIEAYFARYPGIRTYMDETRKEARACGYVVTPFGRRCHIAGIAEKNPARRAYAERQAINAPLQGGAADIIKRAMVRLPAILAEAGLPARLLLQVHDELLFEVRADQAEPLAALARSVMENAARLRVPLVVETGIAESWAHAH